MHVYDHIVETGMQELYNMQHAGLRALGSILHEKGYRDYGHDMDNTNMIPEVGLGFTCDFEKPSGFIVMDAVLEHKRRSKAAVG
jgi:4-methylaminobutanoate oxidase (formaldehyde-forming)